MKQHLPKLPQIQQQVPQPEKKPQEVIARSWWRWPIRKAQVQKAQNAKQSPPEEEHITVPHRKSKRRRLQRKSLQEYLDKAGFEADAENVKKRTFQIVIALFLVLTVVVLTQAVLWKTHETTESLLRLLAFVLSLWTVFFAAALLLAMGGIFFFLDYRIYQRTRELEEVLPDFLQLASANIAAGMPIDRALWYSIRPNFGVLAKEMEEVAKATMAGESLEQSLLRFTDKYESTTLKRSINILIEGLHAGGEMADLLNKIALNIEELKIMKKEMAANVTTYAIFITFASIMIAPFLFALATELLIIIVKITGSLDLSSGSSMFSFSAADPKVIDNFRLFSIMMLIASTMFSASIVSVIKRGNVMEGIKTIPVYAAVAIVIYFFSLRFLDSIFSTLI